MRYTKKKYTERELLRYKISDLFSDYRCGISTIDEIRKYRGSAGVVETIKYGEECRESGIRLFKLRNTH
jgi:hypothetical protein